MNLPRAWIEQKLSALLGAAVTLGDLKLSILSRSLEVSGVSVAGESAKKPMLTVERVMAEVSVSHALAGQLHIRSLKVRGPAGNLSTAPRRAKKSKPVATTAAPTPAAGAKPAAATEPSWKMELRSVQVTDGELQLQIPQAGWNLSAEKISLDVDGSADGKTPTRFVARIGLLKRVDPKVSLGAIDISGSIDCPLDPRLLFSAPLKANITAGKMLNLQVSSPGLEKKSATVSLHAELEMPMLLDLLPSGITLPPILAGIGKSGTTEVSMEAELDAERGVTVRELTFKVVNVSLPSAKPANS